MEFHELIAIVVVGIALILFGIVVWISCRHHKAINKLNDTLSSFGSAERIAIDVRDINLSVRIIAYIAIVFCLGVAIHYMAIALPRIYEAKENAEKLQNFGVDYLGLIVAIFAIIVTLLVTWNIYSTIKAKEELKEHHKKLKNEYDLAKKKLEALPDEKFKSLEDSIDAMSQCCAERKDEIKQLREYFDKQINTIELGTVKANAYLQMATAKSATQDYEKRIYGEAYRLFMKALLLNLAIKAGYGEIKSCCEQLNLCLDELESAHQNFDEATYTDSMRMLDSILSSPGFSGIDDKIRRKIHAIKTRQEEIYYISYSQSIRNIATAIYNKRMNEAQANDKANKPASHSQNARKASNSNSSRVGLLGRVAATPLAGVAGAIMSQISKKTKRNVYSRKRKKTQEK